ncbi:hypothetical protein DFJ73DRAFT_472008 [Zopfochytrium polystomum]|nr:hypothetical protein DFJ73DRAFT_472008 [Zopfochytrium polystomum]
MSAIDRSLCSIDADPSAGPSAGENDRIRLVEITLQDEKACDVWDARSRRRGGPGGCGALELRQSDSRGNGRGTPSVAAIWEDVTGHATVLRPATLFELPASAKSADTDVEDQADDGGQLDHPVPLRTIYDLGDEPAPPIFVDVLVDPKGRDDEDPILLMLMVGISERRTSAATVLTVARVEPDLRNRSSPDHSASKPPATLLGAISLPSLRPMGCRAAGAQAAILVRDGSYDQVNIYRANGTADADSEPASAALELLHVVRFIHSFLGLLDFSVLLPNQFRKRDTKRRRHRILMLREAVGDPSATVFSISLPCNSCAKGQAPAVWSRSEFVDVDALAAAQSPSSVVTLVSLHRLPTLPPAIGGKTTYLALSEGPPVVGPIVLGGQNDVEQDRWGRPVLIFAIAQTEEELRVNPTAVYCVPAWTGEDEGKEEGVLSNACFHHETLWSALVDFPVHDMALDRARGLLVVRGNHRVSILDARTGEDAAIAGNGDEAAAGARISLEEADEALHSHFASEEGRYGGTRKILQHVVARTIAPPPPPLRRRRRQRFDRTQHHQDHEPSEPSDQHERQTVYHFAAHASPAVAVLAMCLVPGSGAVAVLLRQDLLPAASPASSASSSSSATSTPSSPPSSSLHSRYFVAVLSASHVAADGLRALSHPALLSSAAAGSGAVVEIPHAVAAAIGAVGHERNWFRDIHATGDGYVFVAGSFSRRVAVVRVGCGNG